MLRSLILLNLRLLKKRKAFYAISLTGLSLGIAFTGLIYLFIKFELSFDQFHVNKNHIYRLESNLYSTFSKDNDPHWRLPELWRFRVG